ncbi:MAG TPA: hypothetical protein PKA26_02495 [bacterium]|nr:hypothetical protein [bacterium]
MSANLKKTNSTKLQQVKKSPVKKATLPFTAENYYIFFAGIITIIIGYVCLATPPVYGTVSMTIAPILLVLGYLVIIPVAILYRKKEEVQSIESTEGI